MSKKAPKHRAPTTLCLFICFSFFAFSGSVSAEPSSWHKPTFHSITHFSDRRTGELYLFSGIIAEENWFDQKELHQILLIQDQLPPFQPSQAMLIFPHSDITHSTHIIFPNHLGKSYQDQLLERGLALVKIETGTEPTIINRFKQAENRARTQKLGIWADKKGFIRKAERPDTIQRYQIEIVLGTIQRHYKAKQGLYLNFGTDHKTDFTAFLPKFAQKGMLKQSIRALQSGQRVELRGFVRNYNGPFMTLMHETDWRLIQE